ncbi:MAG TPA: hypothetical protein VG167_07600, partial [Verrucomicrobiae bacterium]|nr:hypothetical protein [Verrucomicrobiae bacterium]
IADPRNNTNYLEWCGCGALESITDPLNGQTRFFYNNQGLLTNVVFPDYSAITNFFDSVGRVVVSEDDGGRELMLGYNNQGLVTNISNSFGRVQQAIYDSLNRPITITDANGVSMTNQFDLLNRLTSRTWQDNFSESFGYSAQGLIAYTNRDGKWTLFSRDNAGRLAGVTNANGEISAFQYNALDELSDLYDGRTNHTVWHYNQYGWLTNKVDALNREIVRYTRDPNGQVTNRLTPQFGNTAYAFDPAGNLTNITYSGSSAPSVSLSYDALNRLIGMADGAGSHTFNYTAASQLQTELGPWTNDGVTNSYAQQLRTALALAQPSGGAWSQSYGYDSAWRLTSLASPAGSFGYGYNSSASTLVRTLALPNGAWETNHFDSLARMDFTALVDHWGHILDGYGYIQDPLGLRTNITRYLGMSTNKVAVGYDAIGQITSWTASEWSGTPRLNEQLAWAYDKSDNLQFRTNGALVQTFIGDPANELTNVTRTGALTISGATPTPASVTVNGQTALTYGDLTFAATNFIVTNGLNTYTTIAHNTYGTNATNVVSATLPSSVTLQWDLNGNLT